MKWVATTCGLIALGAAWLTLGPMPLGGSTGYAMIIGTSMEPKLHRGDIALVRRSSDYRVGQTVAYHSRELDRTVLHRIVAIRNGQYVFKGDNNDFIDPGTAVRSDLIGAYWLKLAGAAPVLQWIQTPRNAAIIAGGLGVLLLGGGLGAAGHRRGRRGARARARPAASPELWTAWQLAITVAGVSLLAFGCLAAVAVHTPSTRQVPVERVYSQSGTFTYSAAAIRSAAYPTGRVHSGDAVFVRLVRQLRLGFAWRFATDRPHLVHGTAGLALRLTDGSGWSHRIVLAPPKPFAGDLLDLRGTLDLPRLERLLRAFESVTGTRAGSYQVSVAPDIRLQGYVDGKPMTDAFSPPLALTVDQLRLQLVASTDPSQPNGLTRTQDASGQRSVPNDFGLASLRLPLEPVRRFAIGGAVVSLLALLAALLGVARTAPRDECARLRARHARMLVTVDEITRPLRLVDVASFEELLRLAERYDRLILDYAVANAFVVEDDGVAYRWRPTGTATVTALDRLADLVERVEEERPARERRDLSTRPWTGSSPRPPAASGHR